MPSTRRRGENSPTRFISQTPFSKAIELDPKNTAAFTARGHAHLAAGDRQQAIRDFNMAIECDALAARAYAYQQSGDQEKALADHDAALPLMRQEHEDTMVRLFGRAAWRSSLSLLHPAVPPEIDRGMLLDAWQRKRSLPRVFGEDDTVESSWQLEVDDPMIYPLRQQPPGDED